MSTTEKIREAQAEVSNLIKEFNAKADEGNADTMMRLTNMAVEAGMCSAAFEIAIQLAELNENLETVIDRTRGKIRIDTFQV